jgi:hypothetical protein
MVGAALNIAVGIRRLLGHYLVFQLFLFSVGHPQVETVLLHSELSLMADGKNDRVLQIQRANVVIHSVGSE